MSEKNATSSGIGPDEPLAPASGDATAPDELATRLPSMENEELRIELLAASRTVLRLRAENDEVRTSRWRTEVQLQSRIQELERSLQTQADAIQQLRASTSWRLTRPLRESTDWLRKKKTALRNLGNASGRMQSAPQFDAAQLYAQWIERYDTLGNEDIELIRAHIRDMALPRLQVEWNLLTANAGEIREAIETLREQHFQNWSGHLRISAEHAQDRSLQALCREDSRIDLIGPQEPPPQRVAGSWLLLIERPGRLATHALYLLQESAFRTGRSSVLADEDILDGNGNRSEPRFMPRYSPELPTTGGLVLLSGDAAARIGDARGPIRQIVAELHALTGEEPIHVPFVLFHRREASDLHSSANAELPTGPRQHWPTITVIIPTRDRFDLMSPCLSSILELTDYPRDRYQIVVVDNGSVEPALLDHLSALERAGDIHVIKDPRKFNYARLNNVAVAETSSDLLAFVNNDIVVHDPLWLQRLAAQATKPDVGVVGAKLLYPDLTIQHGGVVLGIQGVAAHAHHGLPADAPGYLGLSVNTHAISAVTGACIMTRRDHFNAVGGFDERLAVAFNDTLLCMDMLARGLRNIYVASPLLIHYESKTRGLDDNDTKRALFRKEAKYARSRYRDLFKDDPYYNPNLSLESTYQLADPPRSTKPWHRFRRADGRARILILSSTHQIGHGVPVVIDIHVRHLLQEGHQVILGGPRRPHEFEYAGAERVYLESPKEAAALAVQRGVDCVVMHTPPFFSTVRWLGTEIKTLVYDHGEPPPDLFPDADARRNQLIEKDFCLAMADALYANSEATRDDSGHPRMGVIPLGNTHLAQWDEATMRTRREKKRSTLDLEGKILVLNVCRFHERERYYKGIDDYCAVKDRLEMEFPEDSERFVFALVGKGTDQDVDEMESRGLRVFANVSDDEMLDMYCAADVYANFSKWEGYNLGIGQALAMGLNVVASDIPVHRSFPIFTSSNIADQARQIAKIGLGSGERVARATSWAPSLQLLSAALQKLVYGSQ